MTNKTISFLTDIRRGFEVSYYTSHQQRVEFPPGTHGFLYYHSPPLLSKFMSHLRFRVTPTNDPSSFNQGHDLLLPSCAPWQHPLYSKRQDTNHLISQLRHEELIEEKTIMQLDQIRRHWSSLDTQPPSLSRVISKLGQEFLYDVTGKQLWVINFSAQGELQVGQVFLRILREHRKDGRVIPMKECYPFPGEFLFKFNICYCHSCYSSLGKVMARFELANPRNPHLFVVRVTKILKPAVWSTESLSQYGPHILPPQEGELLKRAFQRKDYRVEPRVFNVRRKAYASLRLLT